MPEQIAIRLEECYQQAEQHFDRKFPRPEIGTHLRGQSAGAAYPQRNMLRFNMELYRANSAHFLRQTVAHEVAHLLAYALYGKHIRPHGSQWQAIMQKVFGLPAERCHQYRLPPSWKTLYAYACQCRQHQFTAQRHARVRRGQAYVCRSCRQPLAFTGQAERKLVQR